MSYSDLAIWIDAHAYEPDVDIDTIYEYLCILTNLLAHQAHYFYNEVDYNDFCYYLASKCLLRLRNPKQFDENQSMERIKSIENYIKSIIYPEKIKFQRMFYKEYPQKEEVATKLNYSLLAHLNEVTNINGNVEFQVYLTNIPQTVWGMLKQTPYYKSKYFRNMYISCLLTLLGKLTPANKIKRSEFDDTILFHLPDKYRDYIKLMVRRCYESISDELYSLLDDSYYPMEILWTDTKQTFKNGEDY